MAGNYVMKWYSGALLKYRRQDNSAPFPTSNTIIKATAIIMAKNVKIENKETPEMIFSRRNWRIALIIMGATLSLWFFWPRLIRTYYSISGLSSKIDLGTLGQLGDSFGVITSLFTLIALLLSLSVNYLQYLQFVKIEGREVEGDKREKLKNHLEFSKRLYTEEMLDTLYMIQYNNLSYKDYGSTKEKISHDFIDIRDNRKARTDNPKYYTSLESRVDSLLSLFEEYLVYVDNDLVDSELSKVMLQKIKKVLGNREILKYIKALHEYYGGVNDPYMRLRKYSEK